MNLNDLLQHHNIDPQKVLVLRHRPPESKLSKVLPWLAAERHDLFNAYQQTQNKNLEHVMQKMQGDGYIASFIAYGPAKALFVGLYTIVSSIPLSYEEYWQNPVHMELESYGNTGWIKEDKRSVILRFNLTLDDFHNDWKGRLIVNWPPPERSWWRRAHRNIIPIHAILEDSVLDAAMPEWNEIEFTWEELRILPTRWKSVLSQWRGIYYIFDTSDGKGYVGSAYGENNLLGRWLDYAASGHGGNRLLLMRNPRDFRFTILQRVSPDMDPDEIIKLESSWKKRLHTYKPDGLNDN